MMVSAVLGALVGAVITLLIVMAWNSKRGNRDLGSDADIATYRTLRYASRAAESLRGGLEPVQAIRAARDIRSLLGCEALTITSIDGMVETAGNGADPIAVELSARARNSAKPALSKGSSSEHLDAVAAPFQVGSEYVGSIVAFNPTVRAPLVRATTEVAAWVGTQLELRELDDSRAQLAEARLRALRAQISPHFIYNSLTAIASFIITDPHRARDLVLEFAAFTRYSFRRHGDFTTLAEELKAIHSYLLLERARFDERLKVSLKIAPEVLSTIIPFLSLQPLVENAVRHGLESRESGGQVTITASDVGTDCEIVVEDDGVGAAPEHMERLLAGESDGPHVGLRNVDARLRHLYGQDQGIEVETNVGAGMLVRLRVPKSQPMHDLNAGVKPA